MYPSTDILSFPKIWFFSIGVCIGSLYSREILVSSKSAFGIVMLIFSLVVRETVFFYINVNHPQSIFTKALKSENQQTLFTSVNLFSPYSHVYFKY